MVNGYKGQGILLTNANPNHPFKRFWKNKFKNVTGKVCPKLIQLIFDCWLQKFHGFFF